MTKITRRKRAAKTYREPRVLSLAALGLLNHMQHNLSSDGLYHWGDEATGDYFGVSRSPIKTACDELIEKGFISDVPQKRLPSGQNAPRVVKIKKPCSQINTAAKNHVPPCSQISTGHTRVTTGDSAAVLTDKHGQRPAVLTSKHPYIEGSTTSISPPSIDTSSTKTSPLHKVDGCLPVSTVPRSPVSTDTQAPARKLTALEKARLRQKAAADKIRGEGR